MQKVAGAIDAQLDQVCIRRDAEYALEDANQLKGAQPHSAATMARRTCRAKREPRKSRAHSTALRSAGAWLGKDRDPGFRHKERSAATRRDSASVSHWPSINGWCAVTIVPASS